MFAFSVDSKESKVAMRPVGFDGSDDGSCTISKDGCTDATATNFDSTATVLEGCVATHLGCTDSVSDSYVSGANTDDDSCVYNVYGCSDDNALNFDSTATVSSGCVTRGGSA